MPYTLNGFGTWYWGKTNIHRRNAACEFCNNYGELASYDTTLYVVALFIPLVPLKKVHVLDECPACRKHRAVKLREWEALRDKTLSETLAAYSADIRNESKAIAAVQAAIQFRMQDPLLRLAPALRKNLPNSPEVHNLLGAAYAFFGQPEQAQDCYRHSLALKPNRDIADALAVLLLRSARPEEAHPYLQYVADEKLRDKVGLAYLLVEGYQSAGKHDQALAVLETLLNTFPDLKADAEFARYHRLSEKHRLSGKPLPSPNLRAPAGDAVKAPSTSRLPKLVGPAILLLALTIYLGAAYSQGTSREVFLVNGLPRAYDVELNGQRISLPPMTNRLIHLPEGTVALRSADPALALPPQTCQIQTSFFARPFLNRTFVINPDRVALLMTEQTTYSANPDPNAEEPFDLHTGQLLYSFSDIDYRFTEFPRELKLQNKSQKLKKQRLAQFAHISAPAAVLAVASKRGPQAGADYLRNCLQFQPNHEELIAMVPILMGHEAALEFIRPRLAARPLLIDWHRLYQEVMEHARPEHDLYAEYKAYLQKEPGNSALAYLAGRAAPDRAESRRLFLQAAQANPPLPYAYHALAFDKLASADFAGALDMSRKALQLAPQNRSFSAWESRALMALGRYDEVLAAVRKQRTEKPEAFRPVIDEVHLLACKGQLAAASSAAESYLTRMANNTRPDTLEAWRNYLQAQIAYVQGDAAGYARLLASAPDATDRFAAALSANRLFDAEKALQDGQLAADHHLLLYLAAHDAGKTELANRALQSAVETLAKGNREHRLFAQWLSGKKTPDAPEACALILEPGQKCIALAALAKRFPADRPRYAAAAKALNFDRQFPYLLLQRLLEKP